MILLEIIFRCRRDKIEQSIIFSIRENRSDIK